MSDQASFVDLVRKRPGLYIGPPDLRGVYELLYNVCEAALSTTPGHRCSRITLTITADGAIEIACDGRYPEMDDPTLPDSLTNLLSHPQSTQWMPEDFLSIMNALAERLTFELFTGTRHVSQSFSCGRPLASVQDHGPTSRLGRRLTFVPDHTIIGRTDQISMYPLIGKLRTLAALHAGLEVVVQDQRNGSTTEIVYRHGIRSLLDELTYHHDFTTGPSWYCRMREDEQEAEVAIKWSYPTKPIVQSYANNRPTSGGSHITATWKGLARAFDAFARAQGAFADDIPPLRVRDLPSSLATIISIQAPNATYADAIGNTLVDPGIARLIRRMIVEQLPAQLAADPKLLVDWAERHAWFRRSPDDD